MVDPSEGTSSLKSPLRSDTVPMAVLPLTKTDAPISSSPAESITLPDMAIFWANEPRQIAISMSSVATVLFTVGFFCFIVNLILDSYVRLLMNIQFCGCKGITILLNNVSLMLHILYFMLHTLIFVSFPLRFTSLYI